VPPPAATSQKSLKTLSSRYEVAQESNLALPAGVNLGGNSVACGKPDKPARHQPRDLNSMPASPLLRKHRATGGRSYLAILARRTNSIIPIGKSANKNAKSMMSIV
jgi:hypothetical protein